MGIATAEAEYSKGIENPCRCSRGGLLMGMPS